MNMDKRTDKDKKIQLINENYKHPHTYVNCDLRYFNFDFLVDKLGHFDGKKLELIYNCNNKGYFE